VTPIISVIIAAYKADQYLRQAIASALEQTFSNFEIVVSDDANDAATRRLVEAFGDQRIVYRANGERLGPAGNHWAAFRQARGRYIAILNHDDLWHPDFLAHLLAPLEADADLVLAFSDHDIIDEQGRRLVVETENSTHFTKRDVLAAGRHQPFAHLVVAGSLPIAQGAVLRKSALILDELPADAGPAYDLWLCYLLAKTGRGAFYIPKRLSSWRRHDKSLSVFWGDDWSVGSALCWARIAVDPSFTQFRRFARQRAAVCYSVAAVTCLRNGRRRLAAGHALRALARVRFVFKPYAVLALSLLPAGFNSMLFQCWHRYR
jgi:glycosyltransferase involved in cell wall biosynthesis